MNSQTNTLIQNEIATVTNAKIAAAARLYAAAHVAYNDAVGAPDQPACVPAAEAFDGARAAAFRDLLAACEEPGRPPFPEQIRPAWLRESRVLIQGQIYDTRTGQPLYASSDGHTLVVLPGQTDCRCSADKVSKITSFLTASAEQRWHGDASEILSWLAEIADGPGAYWRDTDEEYWPICIPWSAHEYDGARLIDSLLELDSAPGERWFVEEALLEHWGHADPMLRVIAPSFRLCLMGIRRDPKSQRKCPAQPLPLVAL